MSRSSSVREWDLAFFQDDQLPSCSGNQRPCSSPRRLPRPRIRFVPVEGPLFRPSTQRSAASLGETPPALRLQSSTRSSPAGSSPLPAHPNRVVASGCRPPPYQDIAESPPMDLGRLSECRGPMGLSIHGSTPAANFQWQRDWPASLHIIIASPRFWRVALGTPSRREGPVVSTRWFPTRWYPCLRALRHSLRNCMEYRSASLMTKRSLTGWPASFDTSVVSPHFTVRARSSPHTSWQSERA